jgi:hypothetical protein
MTKINRLTQITEAQDNDIIPIWDYNANRTRGVLASTLKEYVAADEVIDAKIVNDHLILITKQGDEIDAGKLPTSDGIDMQNDGTEIGEFSTLNFGEGLKAKPSASFGVIADIDIDKDKVYTKDVELPINIDDLNEVNKINTGSGIYSLKKGSEAELVNRAPFARTLRFDDSLTLNEPYDGLTAIYAANKATANNVFHLDIDPDDSRLNKDWVFTIAIDSDINRSTLECKIGKTNPLSFILSTGFVVLEVDTENDSFVVHNQSSTVIGDLPSEFCDLSNSEWKNISSKDWIVRDGTLNGFGSGINGKTARLHCQVSNLAIEPSEIGARAIYHVYTIVSDDATINGRVFTRSSKSISTFDASILREETNSAGSGSITIDGNSADKIVSGDGIETNFDPATNTSTIIAKDFKQPDVAGFGTVSELPRHLIKPKFDIENLTYIFDEDKFNARFANGEPGPSFKITAQKLDRAKWELGFTYEDRITNYETVMSRMLIQFIPGESTGTFDDLVNKVDFRCEKGIGGIFKHKHEGQNLLELWCVAATSEFPNRFFIELDLSANNDRYVFNTREPQFTEYLFPWNDNNKPPQFIQLEEGMNNQGKMGTGSNIDSSSVTQGKVYVDDFVPANGGPEGLEGNARKGYVIKHYGFNDQETASVIWFYNFVGDIYVKMNKDQFDKGRWNKITGSRFANTVTASLNATNQEFLSVDKNTPAVTMDEIDSFVLTKIESPESEGVNPKIKKAVVGELASGFSLCPDNTPADTQILQISSGTYSLDSLTFAIGAAVDDPVYVGDDGKLTLDESDYVVGWVLTEGVLIDIDLYNASVKANGVIPENGYIEKFTNADTERVQIAYEGKYGDDRNYYPIEIKQDVNGWTQFEFTGNMQFKTKSKDTGSVSNKIFEIQTSGSVFHKKVEMREPLNITKETGTVFTINDEAIKFWSSGAIELPNYKAFKDKELITKEYAQQLIDESGGGSDYYGQGLGVPEGEFVTTETMNQSQPTAIYYNALNDGSSRGDIELNNDDGYNEFHVIIQGLTKVTRDWRIGTGTPGRYSDKTIRTGETWLCRVFVDWNASSNTNFFWTRLDDGTVSYVDEGQFNAKSGYSKLYSGGGSTHTITYSENGSILNISNPTVKVQLLQGMSDDIPHGYIKYINSRNSDVQFEWYNRNGDQVTNNVPSVCPANTVVEIFADYSKDEYVLSFGQSKVINSINEEDQLMEGLAQGFIYAKSVSVG